MSILKLGNSLKKSQHWPQGLTSNKAGIFSCVLPLLVCVYVFKVFITCAYIVISKVCLLCSILSWWNVYVLQSHTWWCFKRKKRKAVWLLSMPNRYLVISEKLEEIKSFRELTCLDLSCCKLGDEHELLEHLTNEALSRYWPSTICKWIVF